MPYVRYSDDIIVFAHSEEEIGQFSSVIKDFLVKRFNTKLFDNPVDGELTRTRWFFPVINTHRSLKIIDAYMQDCIRALATGKRTKSRFDCRYDDTTKLGYRSLINEYYKARSEEDK